LALHENRRNPKILALHENIGGYPKYGRLLKTKAEKLGRVVKSMRHIIYDRTKADAEISVPGENLGAYQKVRRPSKSWAYKFCVCLLFGLGRISNC
jgi:hypothetical protein